MTKTIRTGFALLGALWLAAAVALLFHNLDANPQIDSQLIGFGFGWLRDMQAGHWADAFLAMRKYPLLPVMAEAGMFAVTSAMLIIGGTVRGFAELPAQVFLHPAPFHFAAKLLGLLASTSTLLLLPGIARKLFPDRPAHLVLLPLLTSVLFLTFATSVRPHPLVMFVTVLTLDTSLRLAEHKSWRRWMMAFGMAGLSFATLQSGVLAIVFPAWAMLCEKGRVQGKALWRPWMWLGIVGALLVGFLLGYTHILSPLVGRSMEYGIGLGNTDMDHQPWTGGGFRSFAVLMLGSEPLLLLALLLSMLPILRRPSRVHPVVWGMLLYAAAYIVLFGLNANTPPRFFLPLLPILALLALPAIAKSRLLTVVMMVLGIFVNARFFTLARQPDTYQSANTFLAEHTQGPLHSEVPWYFLGIPPSRASTTVSSGERERYIRNLDHDLPDARSYVPVEHLSGAAVFVARTRGVITPPWTLCNVFKGAAPHTDSGFLWGEVDWALWHLLSAPSLGPPLWVACHAP